MATNHRGRKSPHDRLDEAGRYMAALERRVKALEGQMEQAFTRIEGFGQMVRDTNLSIQKAAQSNYRSLDERMAALEAADKATAKALNDLSQSANE